MWAFLGLFLLAAGIGKALDGPGYVDVIGTYEMGLARWARWVTVIAIIIVETGLGLWILSGRRTAVTALSRSRLHTGYFILLTLTLLRGIEVPNCGCFGVFLVRPLEPVTVLEDLVLVAFSWGLYALARKNGDGWNKRARDAVFPYAQLSATAW